MQPPLALVQPARTCAVYDSNGNDDNDDGNHDNWNMYGTANWGGHWRYKKQEGDTDEEHMRKFRKAEDEGRLGQ